MCRIRGVRAGASRLLRTGGELTIGSDTAFARLPGLAVSASNVRSSGSGRTVLVSNFWTSERGKDRLPRKRRPCALMTGCAISGIARRRFSKQLERDARRERRPSAHLHVSD